MSQTTGNFRTAAMNSTIWQILEGMRSGKSGLALTNSSRD